MSTTAHEAGKAVGSAAGEVIAQAGALIEKAAPHVGAVAEKVVEKTVEIAPTVRDFGQGAAEGLLERTGGLEGWLQAGWKVVAVTLDFALSAMGALWGALF